MKFFSTLTFLFSMAIINSTLATAAEPEYFNLRPGVEKAYGYSHAVKIGNDIKISGAVSMDDEGNATAVGDLEQQMKIGGEFEGGARACTRLEKQVDHGFSA